MFESILVFGLGAAKGKLNKRLENDKLCAVNKAVEAEEDTMTDSRIAAKIREYFHRKEG